MSTVHGVRIEDSAMHVCWMLEVSTVHGVRIEDSAMHVCWMLGVSTVQCVCVETCIGDYAMSCWTTTDAS